MPKSVVKDSKKIVPPKLSFFAHTLEDFKTCRIPNCPKCAEFAYNIYMQTKTMFKEEPKEKKIF